MARGRKSGAGAQEKKEDHDDIASRRKLARTLGGDPLKDEVDDFHDARDKVRLARAGDAEESDESEEDEKDRTMMDLDLSDSDLTDEFEEDGAVVSSDDDEDGDEDVKLGGWGKSKKVYYDADEAASSDEEFDQDEGAEALRLQKEKAALLKEEDFGLDEDEDEEEEEEKSKKKPKKKTKTNDEVLLKKMNEELNDIDDFGAAEVETVKRDISKISEQEKLQVLITDAPELLTLLSEFQEKVNEVKNRVQPLVQRVKDGNLPTSSGISFLELKYHLLLNYCMNIAFYLLLKAEGKSIKDHPVVMQLVKIRTVLEKIKPIDSKLKYQIDKLIKTAEMGDAAVASGAADPLKFKPNPEALISKMDDEGDQGDGVYRAPRMAAVSYDEDEAALSKEKKKKENRRDKLRKSEMIKNLRAEYDENPEEDGVYGGTTTESKIEEADMERQRYEEENFVRLSLTKEEKKRKKTQARKSQLADFQDLDDFGDMLAGGDTDRMDSGEKQEMLKKKSLMEYLSKIEQSAKSRKRAGNLGGDEDLPRRDDEARYNAAKKRQRPSEFLSEHDDEPAEPFVEDPLYTKTSEAKKKKKQERADTYKIERPVIGDSDVAGGRRETTWQIEKNKGLTPHRPKEARNARVKLRNKYSKALIKRKSTVHEVAGSDVKATYGGESTGIKKNLSRSVKIKS